MLALTPAYDLCPQARSGASAYELAMPYDEEGRREARIASLINACHLFLLDRREAHDIAEALVESIRANWDEVCDLAQLTTLERDAFWGRQFLNPAVTN
jgi:serine/threonine-protein kinase HipA